jgi:hypothetical protein
MDASMKLLMIIIDSDYKEELEVLLNRHDVVGYTELPQVHGVGTTGVRKGSRAFPKTSSVIFTVMPAERIEPLTQDIKTYCDACTKRMKMIVWNVEQLI